MATKSKKPYIWGLAVTLTVGAIAAVTTFRMTSPAQAVTPPVSSTLYFDSSSAQAMAQKYVTLDYSPDNKKWTFTFCWLDQNNQLQSTVSHNLADLYKCYRANMSKIEADMHMNTAIQNASRSMDLPTFIKTAYDVNGQAGTPAAGALILKRLQENYR